MIPSNSMQIKDTNKIIFIDLTKGNIEVKALPEKLIAQYLGGRGINSYLLYQYTNHATDPLGPDNVLIIGTGLFTGLKGLSFSRTTISAKSPESGILGDANIGGGFGVNLRRNGFGYIVIRGKAAQPTMLVINKDKIELKPAKHLWGKDTQETQAIITETYPESETLCIGQAGEKKVVFACIMNRKKNAAARCGMGAVMGSKNLKAIVMAQAGDDLAVENKEEFFNCLRGINKIVQNEFLIQRLKEYGSAHLYEIINESIIMGRVKNGRTLAFNENENINLKNIKSFQKQRAGCKDCIIRCHYSYECKGAKNEGPEYGIVGHFGPVLGIGKIEDVLGLNELANRVGMDVSSVANIIAWVIELYELKLINKKLTGGRELKWSDPELIRSLILDIDSRQGLGDFIASGPREMLKKLPKEAADYLCWTKYLVQSEPVDLRYLPAYALSNSVASRGSDHLRSRPIWVAFEYPQEVLKEVYGREVDPSAQSYKDKGIVVFWWEHYLAMFDLLGLCKFLGFHTLPPGVPYSFFKELVKTAYGLDLSEKDLKEIGQRVINIERLYLEREGITRENDYPPSRTFLPLAETAGVREEDRNIKLDRKAYDEMLDDYYAVRGWSKAGKVSPQVIKRLNLDQLENKELAQGKI